MKRTGSREAVAVSREVVKQAREAGCQVIINDRVDWALLSGADGVHLGDEDLLPADARSLLGEGRIIGVTVRSARMAAEAKAAGADYVGAGPVFATSSKQVPAPVMGLEAMRVLVGESPLPVVAIGGIGLGNIPAVAETGAHSAAVLSDLLVDFAARGEAGIVERVRRVREAFERVHTAGGAGNGR
jgi:thiamine-phosphate pyrophosphorylase